MIRTLRIFFYASLSVGGILLLALAVFFFLAVQDLPQVPDPLSRIIETPPTEIFAATDERLMVIGGRETVPLSSVSQDFINAVIATEDHRFWHHHGIDKLRTLKALAITLFVPGEVQGASTITQQLAKNLFFSFKRSYLRKFRELLVALQIESQFSKEAILEAYVNQIPFDARSNGIEQAARTFFGKNAAELSLSEAALLAGLPKSPTIYNPYRHMERAKRRQRVVLLRMVASGYISRVQADEAFAAPLQLVQGLARKDAGSYFLDMVIRDLEQRYGPDVVYHGGLKVFTTLDPQMQIWASEAVLDGLQRLETEMQRPQESLQAEDNNLQGALVAVDPKSGAVKAMVGGRSYAQTAYNRAIQNNRQPGSGFKPFIYYTAFEKQNLSPATVMIDRPVKIPVAGAPDWEPRNFGREYHGPMVLKRALMESVNSIAAQLINRTGPEAVIDTVRRCGIESPLEPVYSLALGTGGASPLEMASAFATFAAGGVRHRPYWIGRVEDAQGRILEEHILSGQRVLDPDLTFQVVDMLEGAVDSGTATIVRRLGFNRPAAGKTGTTSNFRDAWFTGFTPTLCASVWIGFDDDAALKDREGRGITGGRGAAPIWTAFMQRATQGEATRAFTIPPGVHFAEIDPQTGRAPDGLTRNPLRVALTDSQMTDGKVVAVDLGSPSTPSENRAGLQPPPDSGIVEEDLPPNQ